jgi:hypothetical protein
MSHTLYYTIRKGSKAVGENGFTNLTNIKKFNTIEEAYDWLSLKEDAPIGLYSIDTFIEKTAQEL